MTLDQIWRLAEAGDEALDVDDWQSAAELYGLAAKEWRSAERSLRLDPEYDPDWPLLLEGKRLAVQRKLDGNRCPNVRAAHRPNTRPLPSLS